MMLKRHLFFSNVYRGRSHHKAAAASSDDRFTQVFGSIIPKDIPESSAWWKAPCLLCLLLRVCARAARRSRAGSWLRFVTMRNKAYIHARATPRLARGAARFFACSPLCALCNRNLPSIARTRVREPRGAKACAEASCTAW